MWKRIRDRSRRVAFVPQKKYAQKTTKITGFFVHCSHQDEKNSDDFICFFPAVGNIDPNLDWAVSRREEKKAVMVSMSKPKGIFRDAGSTKMKEDYDRLNLCKLKAMTISLRQVLEDVKWCWLFLFCCDSCLFKRYPSSYSLECCYYCIIVVEINSRVTILSLYLGLIHCSYLHHVIIYLYLSTLTLVIDVSYPNL